MQDTIFTLRVKNNQSASEALCFTRIGGLAIEDNTFGFSANICNWFRACLDKHPKREDGIDLWTIVALHLTLEQVRKYQALQTLFASTYVATLSRKTLLLTEVSSFLDPTQIEWTDFPENYRPFVKMECRISGKSAEDFLDSILT